MLSSTELD